MEKRKIILDCDPGHDDAIAMMMAAKHPAIDLLGITVVAGNQILEKNIINALNVCQALGIETPVYSGMKKPLMREQYIAADVHGESGLDGPVFGPLHLKAQPEHAVKFIIDKLLESDGDITLVPVGPLTNIAVAMRMEPAIVPKIREIVLMGGAYGYGNSTPSAEFNIYADPEAARVVFTSGVPIVMMGLDLTNQTICTPDIIERMRSVGNKAGQLFADIMNFTLKTQFEVNGLEAGPIHDATCIGYLIDPGCMDVRDMYVVVDTNEGPCYGRTVCDDLGVIKHRVKANAKVGMGIDTARFFDLVEECIRMYD